MNAERQGEAACPINETDRFSVDTALLQFEGELQFFLIVRAGGGNDDFLGRNNQRTLGGSRTLEHIFHQLLEGVHNGPLGDILGGALDLIALQRGSIAGGNGDFTILLDRKSVV